jgi:hypothetical protein
MPRYEPGMRNQGIRKRGRANSTPGFDGKVIGASRVASDSTDGQDSRQQWLRRDERSAGTELNDKARLSYIPGYSWEFAIFLRISGRWEEKDKPR